MGAQDMEDEVLRVLLMVACFETDGGGSCSE